MKNLNPLKIGKYTFWVSFILGNLFMFGFLFGGLVIKSDNIAFGSAVFGFYYLYVATAVNLIILNGLIVWGIYDINKREQCFIGSAIMLINIPLAILYAFIGFGLVTGNFSFKRLFDVLLFN